MTLKIEVSPESNDERMLVRAFLREHDGAQALFSDWLSVDNVSVTFGRPGVKNGE